MRDCSHHHVFRDAEYDYNRKAMAAYRRWKRVEKPLLAIDNMKRPRYVPPLEGTVSAEQINARVRAKLRL